MIPNLTKRIFALLGVLTILFSISCTFVFATEGENTEDTNGWYDDSLTATPTGENTLDATSGEDYDGYHIEGNDSLYDGLTDAELIHDAYIDVMPVVSTNDILKWATTKGNEIIYFLQIIVQPFTIIIFIVAAFMTLIGSIGRGDMVGKGVWGLICSVLVYAAVLYAPVILQTFVGWVAS